ncbi:MAG: HEAT repeat domain-containing protein [Candidatus Lernaella stagnicola]|nr:HEAT repeat domain-containing protein [Candidatus Lernaella stagnicola]
MDMDTPETPGLERRMIRRALLLVALALLLAACDKNDRRDAPLTPAVLPDNLAQLSTAKKLALFDELADAEPGRGLPLLRAAAQDDDFRVRLAALAARRKAGDLDPLTPWLEALDSGDPEFVMEGAFGIADAGRSDLADKLTPLLQSPHRAVRIEAAFCLIDLEWPGAPKVIGPWARRRDFLAQEAGIRALALAPADRAWSRLLPFATHVDDELADLALHELVRLNPQKAIALLAGFTDQREELRLWAVFFLRGLTQPAAQEALQKYAADPSSAVQTLLAQPSLEFWESDGENKAGAPSPFQVDPSLSADDLLQSAGTGDTLVRRAALKVLVQRHGESSPGIDVEPPVPWAKAADVETRLQFARLATGRTETALRDELRVLAVDRVDRVRQQALFALAFAAEAEDRRLLREAWRAESLDVRQTALLGLSLCGDESAAAALNEARQDPDFSLRATAMLGLAILRPARWREQVREGLRAPEAWVRLAAAVGLHAAGAPIDETLAEEDAVRQWFYVAAALAGDDDALDLADRRYRELDVSHAYDHIRDFTVLNPRLRRMLYKPASNAAQQQP